ncbi:flavin prenyltransferase UbiX [Pseudoteredinibacter isoporae]|uniref:Flavin prenyltransferase UbiX n=1 Tax=Pseudoteredinibacter isoporae TaxID=570281 RepID=A0A7X0MZB3_9GAMM|nr:flavin prenyltransferase UbiX [Pseudoteredinibacter isoporae]MBB6522962.1 4-hydroxy-3-polyprenylbenzoate decarboxylase [Pseudoteredinibacter isoporae]NHO88486.1 UbiX family flavin prenyltransferase [Pseudoteredinibacter isoporae]NIB22115.1 UbiX family flavin prenyltransferase [Pseudoteredinibacter isoporae]
MQTISLAITGGSGAQYALRLLQCLLAAGCQVNLMVSRAAAVVINTETEWQLPEDETAWGSWFCEHYNVDAERLRFYSREDWFSPVASGSSRCAPMVICPASGGTLSAIACGASNNLIERAADVVLKERKPLLLVPREMPYSAIHLENMLKLTQLGAIVMPASPGFYHSPNSIEDLIDFVVARILDQLGIEQDIMPRWGE